MSTRLFEKLEKCKADRDFYQAHQICRTIYVRLGSTNDEKRILEFLFTSACYFLEHNQSNSGYDLCKAFIETLNKSIANELTDDLIEKICTLFKLLRNYHDERMEFACNVLRWSTTVPVKISQQPDEQLPVFRVESNQSFTNSILSTLTEPSSTTTNANQKKTYHKTGHPKLHESFAKILWNQEKNYHDSRYHYLRSYDGQSFAVMLIEAHQTLGYPSEIDLFIAQTVLQYLLLRNFHTAYLVFVTYVEQHPRIQQKAPGPFTQGYPMLNFLWFLLLCLKKMLIKSSSNNSAAFGAGGESNRRTEPKPSVESTRCFSSLVDAYKPSLERDTTLLQYVERIGALFFGIKQKSSSSSNPFEALMSSLSGNMTSSTREMSQFADAELDMD